MLTSVLRLGNRDGGLLTLINGWRDPGCGESCLEMFLEVVGHADGFGPAGFLDGFHLGPGALQLFWGLGPEGRVD
jgi:hypothetical protein